MGENYSYLSYLRSNILQFLLIEHIISHKLVFDMMIKGLAGCKSGVLGLPDAQTESKDG